MEDDNVFNSHPQQPLQSISPNTPHVPSPTKLLPSPSMPNFANENVQPVSHGRRNSDIATKVALFNQLSQSHPHHISTAISSFALPASPSRSPTRTMIRSGLSSPSKGHSRNNSTLTTTPLPANLDPSTADLIGSLQAALEQSRSRERLVSERVESMMEQIQSLQSKNKLERHAWEKEIKQAKRAVYKAERELVKTQHEHESTVAENDGLRNRNTGMEVAVQEARKKEFEAQYALQGTLEELEVAKKEKEGKQGEVESLKVQSYGALQDMEVLKEEMARLRHELAVLGDNDTRNADSHSNWEQMLREKDTRIQQMERDAADWANVMQVKEDKIRELETYRQKLAHKLRSVIAQQKQSQSVDHSRPTSRTESRPESAAEIRPGSAPRNDIPALTSSATSTITTATDDQSEEVGELKEEVVWLRSQLRRGQDLVHFMSMQCHFGTCACRRAEKAGRRFVHDHEYDQQQQIARARRSEKRKSIEDRLMEEAIRERDLSLKQASGLVITESGDAVYNELDALESHILQNPYITQGDSLSADVSQNTHDGGQEAHVGHDHGVAHDGNQQRDDAVRFQSLSSAGLRELTADQPVSLEEAAAIPLPSPGPSDEPTALLEDLTCVVIEPVGHASAEQFNFSMSTSSRHGHRTEFSSSMSQGQAKDCNWTGEKVDNPGLYQSRSIVSKTSLDSVDLFDLAPRHNLPPRPNTVLGLRGHDSPVRLVPPSPQQDVKSFTHVTETPFSRTTRVPLKETSPLRQSHTQPRIENERGRREHSRARSPTPGQKTIEHDGILDSPHENAYFPVTPKPKSASKPKYNSSHQGTEDFSTDQAEQEDETVTGLDTNVVTTRVPLRGMSGGGNDILHTASQEELNVHAQSPQPSFTHAHHNGVPSPHQDKRGHPPPSGGPEHTPYRGRNPMRQPLATTDANVSTVLIAAPGTPGGISREAALAQIKARRDRARSLNMRKLNITSTDAEINGSIASSIRTPVRRGPIVGMGIGRDISNLSQASAPARF